MTKLIASPEYRDALKGPLIFLAGPVQGAEDWQSVAFDLLRELTDAHIASPRRLGKFKKLSDKESRQQVEWEYFHLARAMIRGVILFWLAKEVESIPGRSYAQTTRMELGKMITMHSVAGINVVVGIESGYSGETYVRFILDKDAPDIPIFNNLPGVCLQAAELAE